MKYGARLLQESLFVRRTLLSLCPINIITYSTLTHSLLINVITYDNVFISAGHNSLQRREY